MEKKALGYYGEQAALAYVRHEKGYHVRCCNYRNRLGEIDLIAEDGHTLVFIEVKTRTTAAYGLPCEAVERNQAPQDHPRCLGLPGPVRSLGAAVPVRCHRGLAR